VHEESGKGEIEEGEERSEVDVGIIDPAEEGLVWA